MNQLVSVLCLLATAMAMPGFHSPAAAGNTNKINCCPPDQMSGIQYTHQVTTLSDSDGHTLTVTGKYHINADYANSRVSVRGATNIGKVHMIMRPGGAFVIDDESQTCTFNDTIPYVGKSCVTDMFTSLGPIYYGKFRTDGYSLKLNQNNVFLTVTDKCFPVNQVFSTRTDNATTVMSMLYTNMTATSDPSAFVLPSFCPTQ